MRRLIVAIAVMALLVSGCVTANVLPDGRILFISATGTKLYDPSTGTMTITGSPATGRVGHASAVLQDGRVLVTGGAQDQVLVTSAEILEYPRTGLFTPTGDLTEGRSFHTATTLDNGKVLLTGGGSISASSGTESAPPIATAELYDPGSGTFTATGPMAVGRALHTAIKLADGRVLILGGASADPGAVATGTLAAELYDPASGTFSPAGIQDPVISLGTATLLADGKVLLAGGYQGSNMSAPDALRAAAQIWDPATLAFTDTGAMSAPRALASATLLTDGKVLIAGGVTQGSSDYLKSAEIYDPGTGTFTATGDMNLGRAGQVAARLPDGRVIVTAGDIVFGQQTVTDVIGNAEIYDPKTGTWTVLAVPPQPSPTPAAS